MRSVSAVDCPPQYLAEEAQLAEEDDEEEVAKPTEKASMVICLPEQATPGEGLAVCFNKTAWKQFLLHKKLNTILSGPIWGLTPHKNGQ